MAFLVQFGSDATFSWKWAGLFAVAVAFLGSALSWYLAARHVISGLDHIGQELAHRAARDIRDYDCLPALLTQITKAGDELAAGENLIVDATERILCSVDGGGKIAAITRSTDPYAALRRLRIAWNWSYGL